MNTKRILELPAGSTPVEADLFLCVQGVSGTPVTRKMTFAVLLTLFSTLFKGSWSNVTTYTVGQIIESGGSAYQCVATSLNQAPPNVTYWKLIVSKGSTGAAGAVWRNGAGAPSNGTGVDGDYYLRTTNDDIYAKAGGVYSIVGNFKGSTGDVREWLVGSAAPTTEGEDGDWFLDGVTGDIYGPKADGDWPLTPEANIRGPQGEQGEPGEIGGSGPTGGTIGQVWFKLSSDDYDGEWRIIAIGDISGLAAAIAAKADISHAASHAPGGSSALPWTTIHGRGATGAMPAAAAGNAGYLYFDTTLGKLKRSTGSAWEDVAEAGAPVTHAASHENGGDDEINVGGLSGVLADPQTPSAHAAGHAPGGSDALPWTTIHGRGDTASKPAAVAGNAGYLYYDTTLGKLQRSTGTAWEDVAEGGINSDVQTALDGKEPADTILTATTTDATPTALTTIALANNTARKFTMEVVGKQIVNVAGAIWTARESTRDWIAVASSDDGVKLAACAYIGQIYTSTDSGVTWTARESSRSWNCVASSADGTKLVAGVSGGQLYTSTDSGVTWTARESGRTWRGVASSADGTKLVACAQTGQIYTSTDSGATWTARDSSRQWFAVASSTDGTNLLACDQGGQLYTSTDSGATWTARESARTWYAVASSADGTKLIAAPNGVQLYTSTDSGVTWTARDSGRFWRGLASSADGTKLVAVVSSGQIYTSTDSGATWTARDSSRAWRSVASAADGTKLVACVEGGQLYTSTQTPDAINAAGWDYTGVIKRGANAAATAMQGTAVKDDATGANPAGWDSDALADTSGGGLQARVTGESGATINWKVRVRMTTV